MNYCTSVLVYFCLLSLILIGHVSIIIVGVYEGSLYRYDFPYMYIYLSLAPKQNCKRGVSIFYVCGAIFSNSCFNFFSCSACCVTAVLGRRSRLRCVVLLCLAFSCCFVLQSFSSFFVYEWREVNLVFVRRTGRAVCACRAATLSSFKCLLT